MYDIERCTVRNGESTGVYRLTEKGLEALAVAEFFSTAYIGHLEHGYAPTLAHDLATLEADCYVARRRLLAMSDTPVNYCDQERNEDDCNDMLYAFVQSFFPTRAAHQLYRFAYKLSERSPWLHLPYRIGWNV